MLMLSGEESFAASPERVFSQVTNAHLLADSIPDLISHEVIDEQHLKCVVRPGFSFLRMKMKIDIAIEKNAVEIDAIEIDAIEIDAIEIDTAARKATMHLDARGIGASLTVISRLEVVQQPSGSQLIWAAEVGQMTGLIATVSVDLIKGAADKVIRENWAKLHKLLGE